MLGTTNASASNHTHDYLPLSGGSIHGTVFLNKAALIYKPAANGGNANGITFYNDGGSSTIAGIGAMYDNGKVAHLYMSIASDPWNVNKGLSVNSTDIKFKNNKVWHAGNDGAGSGLDADLLDGLQATAFARSSHTHSYLPLSGGTMTGVLTTSNAILHTFTFDGNCNWSPGANVSMTAAVNGSEWSFDFRKNGKTGCYWHVWDENKNSLLSVYADTGQVRAHYDFNVTGRFMQNGINGNISAIQSGAPNTKMLWAW